MAAKTFRLRLINRSGPQIVLFYCESFSTFFKINNEMSIQINGIMLECKNLRPRRRANKDPIWANKSKFEARSFLSEGTFAFVLSLE